MLSNYHHSGSRRVGLGVTSFGIFLALAVGIACLLAPPASAAEPESSCGDAKTSIITCDAAKSGSEEAKDSANNPVIAILTFVMQILTGAVGIAAIGALIYAGILYSAAGGESAQVQKAKTLIKDTVIGLVCYAFMIVILNFFIPGGVFGQQSTVGGGTTNSGGSGGGDGGSGEKEDDGKEEDGKDTEKDVDTTFAIAALPDTQREVINDARYKTSLLTDTMRWVVANKDKYTIRALVSHGDVVHASSGDERIVNKYYDIASKAYGILDNAGIPYSIAPGNHDTSAICTSNGDWGSVWCEARGTKKSDQLLMETPTFNKTFNTGRKGMSGLTLYEKGRVDNSYRTFAVNNTKWLILTLEYAVPSDAFRWAQGVVASHTDHNIILVTHAYMSQAQNILKSCDGVNCTPATKISSDLVMKYSNVKMVFSGHAGYEATKPATTETGNKVIQFQTTMHEKTTNPLRLVTIDIEKNSATSMLCKKTSETAQSSCSTTKVTGMKYITN